MILKKQGPFNRSFYQDFLTDEKSSHHNRQEAIYTL